MKFASTFIFFLGLNFGALFLGNILMNNGATSDWYLNLNKAPWTPAGWVFWSCLDQCYALFFSLHDFLVSKFKNTKSNFVVFSSPTIKHFMEFYFHE